MELGCDERKLEIIPNGIQLDKYCSLVQKSMGEDYINVGAVVRIVPIKDIKTMIYAFAAAKEDYEKIRFYIMGPTDEDMDYYEECIELVESLGLKDVIFTGKVNVIE
jgi:glycosyltransferase involved in cell wall biosynthesis